MQSKTSLKPLKPCGSPNFGPVIDHLHHDDVISGRTNDSVIRDWSGLVVMRDIMNN